ncbi:MAG TPA: monovalent cation:proton antiporter-2 (CPA2) family protein [Candidatus Omnitrophota bacterium]|nr:monovalent cation:proton antiporter-2 (CPA2) family protein [Candidatus Omnitrophota bacterium]
MAEESASLLFEVLVLLAAAVLAVPLFHRLRIGPVLGYLVAGVVVGPHVLGLIVEVEDIRRLGEYGVVFLLFAIGLELKLERLLAMKRLVFGLGGLQVLVTGLVLASLVAALSRVGWSAAIVIGGGLALSSTAVVLQMLTERGELTDRHGRVAFAVLLMQDLAVVPLLMMVSAMGGQGESPPLMMLKATGRALLVGAAIVVGGRLLVRPFLRVIAGTHSSEVFAAAALLVVLGTAWLTQKAGLSMALGAFMAGLLLAETEFRHQVEADIQPFRGFLLGLFFMTVGMGLDLPLLGRDFAMVVVLLLSLIAIKAAILTGLALLFRVGLATALHAGLLLAQGGEFAFVVFGQAAAAGVVKPDALGPLTLAVTASMFATPLLAVVAGPLAARLSPRRPDIGRLEDLAHIKDHVIVAGFGRVGRTVAAMLQRQGVTYVALDLSPERVLSARKRGLPVYFGDSQRAEVLRAAGAERARALVLTLDTIAASERAMATIRERYPELRVYARARDRRHGDALRDAGAVLAVPDAVEASLQLGALTLRALGTPPGDLDGLLQEIRHDNYAGLGSEES